MIINNVRSNDNGVAVFVRRMFCVRQWDQSSNVQWGGDESDPIRSQLRRHQNGLGVKTIKVFDIPKLVATSSCRKFSIHTSCYTNCDSIKRMIDASEGKVMQHALTTTISLDDLQQEKHFLSGYKATKDGKLVYVALLDFLPSWHGR
jgi:hypothetical protein